MTELEAAGATYREAKAAVVRERKRWAQAEVACATDPSPGNRAEMVAAYEAVQFAKACVLAAGETVKGVTLAVDV